MEKIGNVYITSDYTIFKDLIGNREDVAGRAKRLMSSIKERGQLNPIIVNKRYEVVDGQARLMALKELDMPVKYMVCDYDIEDVIAINNTATKWSTRDYVKSFKLQGNSNYAYLEALFEEFKDMSKTTIMCACSARMASSASALGIAQGTFKLSADRYHEAQRELQYVRLFLPYLKYLGGRSAVYQQALIFCYRTPEVDNDVLFDKFQKNMSFLIPAANVLTATQTIEKIYNYNKKGQKVYISTLYKDRHTNIMGKHSPSQRK